ncbi:hypothetical protein BU26DRAFT_449520 [Trematosphaeria pertusa]|uniref:F-box domain-containing protein n=1 Tax=Trematosphaeria pertusa TaxID=390896 RepID=A0A6A6IRP5_9PLEO|nr:uncharacterized protein BU26DRAFT_449520 [Trematosphaeria pertusa]KAF2253056.1 hypothetical protein BU26DRAFT_449520 [Trematosphaeria pertusa]
MAASSAGSDPDSVAHHVSCPLHCGEVASRCNASTKLHFPCRRAAKNFPSGLLPTCRQHLDRQIQAGRCQATEACGWPCLRLSTYNPPFHLCVEHQNGTDTLPCFFLRVPTEIRLMVFRYVFPDSIPIRRIPHLAWEDVCSSMSLLSVNRQISEEAALVLYGEVPFEVDVATSSISLCGKVWNCNPAYGEGLNYAAKEDAPIPQELAKRIQNYEVQVRLGSYEAIPIGVRTGIGSKYVTQEDYWLYQARDTIGKFVDLINRSSAQPKVGDKPLQRLRIQPKVGDHYSHWQLDEVMAAVVLLAEPFKAVCGVHRPVLCEPILIYRGQWMEPSSARPHDAYADAYKREYRAYQVEWRESLAQYTQKLRQDPELPMSSKIAQANAEMKSIESFVATVYREDERSVLGLTSLYTRNVFEGIARPLHLARVAYECRDLPQLAAIRKVLQRRWINYQRLQQKDSSRMANAILGLFDPSEASKIKHDNPFEFKFTKSEASANDFDPSWPELKVKSAVPRSDEPGTTEQDDRERRYYTKGSTQMIRLKTPAFVRATRQSGAPT